MAGTTSHVLKTKSTSKMFNYDDAVANRQYINGLQGGGYWGTVIGVIGLFLTGGSALAVSIISAATSIFEVGRGTNLELQEDFYSDLSELLGAGSGQTPKYSQIEVKQEMAEVMVLDYGGNLLGQGWVLYGLPTKYRGWNIETSQWEYL